MLMLTSLFVLVVPLAAIAFNTLLLLFWLQKPFRGGFDLSASNWFFGTAAKSLFCDDLSVLVFRQRNSF